MAQKDWNSSRDYDYTEDWDYPAPSGRPAPGKVPATARLQPPSITNIVFRVPDPASAHALGAAMVPRDDNNVAADASSHVARASESSGSPLPNDVRERFETSLDADLGAVRIHTDSASSDASDALGARAYTLGRDVHFGAGEYEPVDPFGLHLLAHEVAHTVQQGSSARTCQPKLAVSAPGDAAEVEADHAADAMVKGAKASVTGTAPAVQLRPKAPTVPAGAQSDAATRVHSTEVASRGNPVDKAVAKIDWGAYQQFLTTTNQISADYDVNSPQVDAAHDQIKLVSTSLKAGLENTYKKEEAKIKSIINDPSDSSLRAPVKLIESKSQQIVEALSKRNGELTTAEGALDTISGLQDAQKAESKKDEQKKHEKNKAGFEAAKNKALADIAANAVFLSGALDFAESAATEGPVGAAKNLAKDAAKGAIKDTIVSAYSKFATGKVNAQYNGRIRSISGKIAGVKAHIKALTSSSLASQLSGASKAFAGSMKKVEAHNKTIGRLKKEVDGHRSEVAVLLKKKHKDVSLFNMTRSASAEMEPLVETYRANLAAAKQALSGVKDHTTWLAQMNGVKAAVSATDRVLGGDLEAYATGEVDMNDVEAHSRESKDGPSSTARVKTARSRVAAYQSAVGPQVAWLTSYGNWIDAEKAFLEQELDKCLGGELVAFIKEFESKVHALIDAKYM